MKNAIVAIFLTFGILSGCAHTDPNYDAYLQRIDKAIEEAKPTFEVKCPPAGCQFVSLSYYDPRDRLIPRQKNPHPVWGVVKVGMKYGFTYLGIRTAAEVISDLADSGNTTYNNSFNEVGGDNLDTDINASVGTGDMTVNINDRHEETHDSNNETNDGSHNTEPPPETPEAE